MGVWKAFERMCGRMYEKRELMSDHRFHHLHGRGHLIG